MDSQQQQHPAAVGSSAMSSISTDPALQLPYTPPVMDHARLESFDWPTDSQSYQLLGKIGRGAFATVWKAIPKSQLPVEGPLETEETGGSSITTTTNHYACAVKILNLDHVDSDLQEIRREVQAMRLSSHANIITCYTSFVNDIHLWLVTTLMRKGSSLHCLQTARHVSQQGLAMEPHIFYILQQSLLGLQYIHETQQAIHRDMKGGNILVDSNAHVRIADFGVSQWLQNYGVSSQKARTFVGTPCWMAPEVMEQHADGYDTKADIWSLGITALELAKGHAPYAKYPPMKVLILTIQEDPPNLDTYLTLDNDDDHEDVLRKKKSMIVTEDYSRLLSDFVDKCLQKNPSRRPTCTELLQHKALQAMTNDATYLEQRRYEMQQQVCAIVPNVGNPVPETTAAVAAPEMPPPAAPHEQRVQIMFEESSKNQERAKGTTWVFSDGSQVLSSTAMSSEEDALDVDDVMDQVEEIGKQQQQQAAPAPLPPPAASPMLTHDDSTDADMDQFLSDLEQTLPGEDYQRDASAPP